MADMSGKKALILYYTCSHNTAKLAKEAEAAIKDAGWQAELTMLRDSEKAFSSEAPDFVILGTPVQYFTVPETALKMIQKLPDMNGIPAFVFASYGGCVANNVPYILADELSKKGAKILGGALFLTPHSCRVNGSDTLGSTEEAFGKGRPNNDDLSMLRDSVTGLAVKIENGEDEPVDLDRLKINTSGFIAKFMDITSPLKVKRAFMPHVETNSSVCTGCKKCAMVCDEGSIDYDMDDKAVIDRSTCTKCYACIEQCGEGALTTNWKQVEIIVRSANKIAKNNSKTAIVP